MASYRTRHVRSALEKAGFLAWGSITSMRTRVIQLDPRFGTARGSERKASMEQFSHSKTNYFFSSLCPEKRGNEEFLKNFDSNEFPERRRELRHSERGIAAGRKTPRFWPIFRRANFRPIDLCRASCCWPTARSLHWTKVPFSAQPSAGLARLYFGVSLIAKLIIIKFYMVCYEICIMLQGDGSGPSEARSVFSARLMVVRCVFVCGGFLGGVLKQFGGTTVGKLEPSEKRGS